MPWSQHDTQQNLQDIVGPRMDADPSYVSSNAHESGFNRLLEGNLQYHPSDGGASLQASYFRLGQPKGASSYETSRESSNQQLPQSSSSYLLEGFNHQGEENTGMLQSGRKTQRKLWKQTHFSTSHRSPLNQDSSQILQPQEKLHQGGMRLTSSNLQHSITSSTHHTNSKELTSILDSPAYHHIHSNIKKALGHVAQDLDEASSESFQPTNHSVHKISLLKKSVVQNVGQEPNHIQSTSHNDDISLSHLIEQLQMLEQSPKHVNITWCEEKIKEFLQALRRKQVSGVFINQEVQEQTLHHILTHETENNTQHREEVHEPLMSKVIVRPLGTENFSHSHQMSEVTMKEQESHALGVVGTVSEHVNTSQEGFQSHSQPEIVTISPSNEFSPPEIMSHQQELPRDVPLPPFTSDNSDDLKDLELELPEYIPFDNTHSGEETAVESHINTDKSSFQPAPKKTETPEVLSGQQISVQEKLEQFPSSADQTELHQHETYRESIGAPVESSNPPLQGENLEPVNSSSAQYQNINQQAGETIHNSYQEENPALNVIYSSQIPKENSKTISHSSSYVIEGRPQVAQENRSSEIEEQTAGTYESMQGHQLHSPGSDLVSVQTLHHQQIDYDTLIEELIQLESIPGHQAIDKCEEKIQEFLEILKYQQEQGFGRNQLELEKLHHTLIQQAKERGEQLANADSETSRLPQTSFWRRVQKKIKRTYENAKDRAKEVLG